MRSLRSGSAFWLGSTLSLLAAAACGGGGGGGGGAAASGSNATGGAALAATPGSAGEIFAVTNSNTLISFTASLPGMRRTATAIAGMQTGENVVAIEFSPSTGDLLAVGSSSRLYKIDVDTGLAAPIGSSAFTPALNGTSFDADVDPSTGKLRVVSDVGQNLQLDVATGKVASVDTSLEFDSSDTNVGASPGVVGLASIGSLAGTTPTNVFALTGTGLLVLVGGPGGTPPPSSGMLFTVGSLGMGSLTGAAPFDAAAGSNVALAAVPAGAASALRRIDLETGTSTMLGVIGGGEAVRALAVASPVLFALTSANRLETFRASNPGKILTSATISGLLGGDSLLSIAFRPATGQLFAIGTSKHSYVVDLANCHATLLGNPSSAPALVGTHYTIDFEPTTDLLRVVTDQAFNLRLSPVTGLVAALDARLFYDSGDPHVADLPAIAAIAYGPSVPGAAPMTLYGIDDVFDTLVRIGGPNGVPSPNDGHVFTIGSLGADATSTLTGFDIDASGGAFATITPAAATASKLVTINLATGAIQEQGNVVGSTLRDIAVPVPSPPRAFAVTSANRLIEFSLSNAEKPTSSKTITGLAAGESIVGIDVRPETGQLFAVTNESRLYRLPTTGAAAATLVGAGPFTPSLSGTKFGVDFDPVSGSLRVVSDTGQNLRINADTGAVTATDTSLAFAPADPNAAEIPNVVAIAYDRSFDGTPATTLFGIDAALASLVRVGGINGTPSPSGGQLTTLGTLGATISVGDATLDIPAVGDAFAVVTAPGSSTSTLYRIDLATGAATPIGPTCSGQTIVGFALAP